MPFQPGQSGNPGGRPKLTVDGQSLTEIAREHTAAAIETLVRIATDEKVSPVAQVKASVALLDRGWGRPEGSVKLSGSVGRGPADKMSVADKAVRLAAILARAEEEQLKEVDHG